MGDPPAKLDGFHGNFYVSNMDENWGYTHDLGNLNDLMVLLPFG